MSRPAKWSLRLLMFLTITFALMLSGVFDPLADSLKYAVTNLMNYSKRPARTVLTGMCYSVGSATRQGSSSLTRFIGQSAMTSRT